MPIDGSFHGSGLPLLVQVLTQVDQTAAVSNEAEPAARAVETDAAGNAAAISADDPYAAEWRHEHADEAA
jgi:hypothetical protein